MSYKTNIIIPKEVQDLIESLNDKRLRDGLLDIYVGFYILNKKGKRDGFFHSPSGFFETIRSHYTKYITLLIENNIIEVYSCNTEQKLFEDDRDIPFYSTLLGISKSYRFLVDVTNGIKIEHEVRTNILEKNWYKITKKSFEKLGLTTHIKRDWFSRRLHTKVTSDMNITSDIRSYKTFFSMDHLLKYVVIDAKTLQPSLLKDFIIKIKYAIDDNYISLFNNDEDIYLFMVENGISDDRDGAKLEFMRFLNSKWYSNKKMKEFFPLLYNSVRLLKENYGYKFLSQKLQWEESQIFIDDILDNIEKDLKIDFCLTVHDSFIVKGDDADKVFDFIKRKYPLMRLTRENMN